MRIRLRLWWEYLPFMAKAALIVLITGLTVTATARAATLADPRVLSTPEATPGQHVSVVDKDSQPPTPAITLVLTSFHTPPQTVLHHARARHRHAAHHRAAHLHHARAASANRGNAPLQVHGSAQSRAASAVGAVRRAVRLHTVSAPVPVGH